MANIMQSGWRIGDKGTGIRLTHFSHDIFPLLQGLELSGPAQTIKQRIHSLSKRDWLETIWTLYRNKNIHAFDGGCNSSEWAHLFRYNRD